MLKGGSLSIFSSLSSEAQRCACRTGREQKMPFSNRKLLVVAANAGKLLALLTARNGTQQEATSCDFIVLAHAVLIQGERTPNHRRLLPGRRFGKAVVIADRSGKYGNARTRRGI